MSKTTLDLSTLSDISDGTHTIKVKAKAEGYRDSEFSNEVSYTNAPVIQLFKGTITNDGANKVRYAIGDDSFSDINSYNSETVWVKTDEVVKVAAYAGNTCTISSSNGVNVITNGVNGYSTFSPTANDFSVSVKAS